MRLAFGATCDLKEETAALGLQPRRLGMVEGRPAGVLLREPGGGSLG
jgi:hypothetical protein